MALQTTHGDSARPLTATRIVCDTSHSVNTLPVVGTVDGTAIGGELGRMSPAQQVHSACRSPVPGSGNLHGNPLCTVLPEDGGPVQGIAALPNRLITGLGF